MSKLIKIFLLLLFTVLLFTTCKKYPEGGFTMRGPKMLLKHNGAWKLTLYEVNGIDSTELINYNGDEKYKNVSFYNEGSNLICRLYPAIHHSVHFANNNKTLFFSSYVPDSTRLCFVNSLPYKGCYRTIFNPEGLKTYWTINKLKKDEMILTLFAVHSYKIKFKPQ